MVVPIVDPGISIKSNFEAYAEGVKQRLFLRTKDNQGFYEGHVWPGRVHFVDFFAHQSHVYWKGLIEKFEKLIPFDGLWIDMNEPASFRTNQKDPPYHPKTSDNNYPPFLINNGDGEAELFEKTINMDVLHLDGKPHLAVHNAYGFAEAFRTATALEELHPGKRHFILSRSTFPGSGRFAAHWLGDNYSDFDNLRYSVTGILEFQLFGIPMVGADICGFYNGSDEELCARWMALGAFYPFSRNHNSKDSPPQEPYRWNSVTNITKKFYALKYSLFPYWYTLLWMAHQTGRPVVRPLFFEFPHLQELYVIDRQFMVGSAILVAPVLDRGARSVKLILPPGVWYGLLGFATDEGPLISDQSRAVNVKAEMDEMPIFLRGGSVILMQEPALTIRQTMLNPYQLVVALDEKGRAEGNAYFDDGISSNPGKAYSMVHFKVISKKDLFEIEIAGTIGHQITQSIKSIKIFTPETMSGTFVIVTSGNNDTMISAEGTVSNFEVLVKGLQLDLNHRSRIKLSVKNDMIDTF